MEGSSHGDGRMIMDTAGLTERPLGTSTADHGGEGIAVDAELLARITVRSDVFGGKPIIRDMRIAVEHVLGMLASGDTADTILSQLPILEPEDIQACLLFAYRSIAGETIHERILVH